MLEELTELIAQQCEGQIISHINGQQHARTSLISDSPKAKRLRFSGLSALMYFQDTGTTCKTQDDPGDLIVPRSRDIFEYLDRVSLTLHLLNRDIYTTLMNKLENKDYSGVLTESESDTTGAWVSLCYRYMIDLACMQLVYTTVIFKRDCLQYASEELYAELTQMRDRMFEAHQKLNQGKPWIRIFGPIAIEMVVDQISVSNEYFPHTCDSENTPFKGPHLIDSLEYCGFIPIANVQSSESLIVYDRCFLYNGSIKYWKCSYDKQRLLFINYLRCIVALYVLYSDHRIIHGNICPDNLVVSPSLRHIMLVDFRTPYEVFETLCRNPNTRKIYDPKLAKALSRYQDLKGIHITSKFRKHLHYNDVLNLNKVFANFLNDANVVSEVDAFTKIVTNLFSLWKDEKPTSALDLIVKLDEEINGKRCLCCLAISIWGRDISGSTIVLETAHLLAQVRDISRSNAPALEES